MLAVAETYSLDDQGRRWVEEARRIASDVAGPLAAVVDRDGRFPSESQQALAASGLCGLNVPTEFGGLEASPRDFVAVVEELSHACASTAMVYVMHIAATQAIVNSTTLARRADILRDIAAGRHLTTLAFSERGSRSQFWAPVSKLVPSGTQDGFVTSACKSWVTSAHQADSFVSSVQQPDAGSPLESTLYLVQPTQPGVKVDGQFDGMGLRGNDSAPVMLDNVAVSARDFLTEQGQGAPAMLQVVLPWFVIGTSAMATGLCLSAISHTVQHLTQAGFTHTSSQLRDLPNLRARVADMALRTNQTRALLAQTLRMMEQPNELTPLYVLQTRLSAVEAAIAVTDIAMQTCGGTAFSRLLPIERFFRDARAGSVMAPTSDHLREFIGRAMTGLPLF